MREPLPGGHGLRQGGLCARVGDKMNVAHCGHLREKTLKIGAKISATNQP